jgi:hypothetical protein
MGSNVRAVGEMWRLLIRGTPRTFVPLIAPAVAEVFCLSWKWSRAGSEIGGS